MYSLFLCCRKGRRKEKDVDTVNKPYLADDLVTKRISNVDLERLVEAPQGLDYNEWLATHSKYQKSSNYAPGFN